MGRRRSRQSRTERRQGGRDRGGRRRGQGSEWDRYKMTQKLVSIGDDFFVENAAGQRVFKIDGKALRVRNTLKMTDLRTGDTYTIQEKLLRVRDSMTVQRNGRRAASVHKAVITPIRDRFTVSIHDGDDLTVNGNVLNHEYKLLRDGQRVAEVSKKWFRVRDSYGIEISHDMDAGIVVACTVAIDMMVHPTR